MPVARVHACAVDAVQQRHYEEPARRRGRLHADARPERKDDGAKLQLRCLPKAPEADSVEDGTVSEKQAGPPARPGCRCFDPRRRAVGIYSSCGPESVWEGPAAATLKGGRGRGRRHPLQMIMRISTTRTHNIWTWRGGWRHRRRRLRPAEGVEAGLATANRLGGRGRDCQHPICCPLTPEAHTARTELPPPQHPIAASRCSVRSALLSGPTRPGGGYRSASIRAWIRVAARWGCTRRAGQRGCGRARPRPPIRVGAGGAAGTLSRSSRACARLAHTARARQCARLPKTAWARASSRSHMAHAFTACSNAGSVPGTAKLLPGISKRTMPRTPCRSLSSQLLSAQRYRHSGTSKSQQPQRTQPPAPCSPHSNQTWDPHTQRPVCRRWPPPSELWIPRVC